MRVRGGMTKRTAYIAAFLNVTFMPYLSRTTQGSMTEEVHLMPWAAVSHHHLLDSQASQHVPPSSGEVSRVEEGDNRYGQHEEQFPYDDAHGSAGGRRGEKEIEAAVEQSGRQDASSGAVVQPREYDGP